MHPIYFKNTTSFDDAPDKLERVKYSCLDWSKDNAGVFYNSYPDQEGKVDGTETTKAASQRLYYHRLGTDQSQDILIAEYPDEPEWMLEAEVSTCGLYLFMGVRKGCERTNKYFFCKMNDDKSLPANFNWIKISDDFHAQFEFMLNVGSRCFIKTNENAPNNKILEIDLENPENRKDFIPEHGQHVLQEFSAAGKNYYLCSYLADCKDVVKRYSLEGEHLDDVSFPDMGSLVVSSKSYTDDVYFKLLGWVNPGTTYKYNVVTNTMEILRTTIVDGFDPTEFTTKQIFYASKDGTKVPMFIVHKNDLELNSENPTILYGYGGFNVSLTPYFSTYRPLWCNEFNGVLCIANIRGGGEYGQKWHDGGKILQKQNCYDDFQAAAEYLIDSKYTNPKKLAIQGGSNGGTLVGVCFNQRPELYQAVLCHCPVILW